MNQNQIQQLTNHLSQALDQNYDVVNMDAVLSVISALEGTTITKEQLEATRLAKYINQLRRRTKNEHLARRAKSLLKKWREMVGIQQMATDIVSHSIKSASQPSQPASDFVKSATMPPVSHMAESVAHLSLSQSSTSQQMEMHSNVDTSEPPPLGLHTQLHTNIFNFVNHMNEYDRDENNSINSLHNQKPIIIEHSSNSMFSVSTEKIHDASVVIDIVSDSDENDNNCTSKRRKTNLSVPVPLSIPTTPSPRQKKVKKEKKCKDREGLVTQTLRICDSDIFSLSNSSMSSILSGDASMATSQQKTRLGSSELTFTGRFKSVNQMDASSRSNFSFSAEKNKDSGKQKMVESTAYDSSASCSRLSPSTVEEVRKPENVFDAIQMPTPTAGIGFDQNSRTGYLESASQSQMPKRRGRKKGSKGVDALIAKESSSLSQQIFFGGSTVKKVKTTKELFNEIQGRKLSTSMQSSTSNLSNSSTNRELTSRAIFPRPTSSCSDTSIHSAHILESYSGNDTFASKIDLANTDSDTATSEPSRDSNKSQEIKECHSFDSNSNSVQNIHLAMNLENLAPKTFNDVTTQLMHLIHSLNSPPSDIDIERMYQAQIVPCTCIVIEEVQTALGESDNSTVDTNTNDLKSDLNYKEKISHHKNEEQFLALERSDNGEVGDIYPKPVKSIFDLDYDDNEDPLCSILDEVRKPLAKLEDKKKKTDTNNVSFNGSTQSVPIKLINFVCDPQIDCKGQERDISEIQNAVLPIFTVQEDPDCIAKQRFYIQTNNVTRFHINALHNFYIPNINGNWDSVDTYPSFQPENDILHTLESYTVTNGADVVPKYGLLTADRIKKDLSSLKLLKPFKAKKFKSLMTPFLGVAKCLPTCRRAKQRVKWLNSSTAPHIISKRLEASKNNIDYKYNSPSPLNVNIDVAFSDIKRGNENHEPLQVDSNVKKASSSQSLDFSANDFSYNLLKLAIDDVHFGDADISHQSSEHPFQLNSTFRCNSSDISRYSRLTEPHHSMNEKPRRKRTRSIGRKSEITSEKKQHLRNSTKKIRHERGEFHLEETLVKKSLNGSVSNLSFNNSSSNSDNDAYNDNENEFDNCNNEEYAIVQRPIGDGGACSNHIVLTIKKTPSKINSPANSITEVSPNTTSDVSKSNTQFYLEDITKSPKTAEIPLTKNTLVTKTCRIHSLSRHTRDRRTYGKQDKDHSKTVDLGVKHLYHLKTKATDCPSDIKLHNKLFFHHELCRTDAAGINERILNYSSSSNSSFDEDSEVENTSVEDEGGEVKKRSIFDTYNLQIETETSSIARISEVKFESEEDSFLTSLSDSDNDDQDEKPETVDKRDDFHNNRMLKSFNSIFSESLIRKPKTASIGTKSSPTIMSPGNKSDRCSDNHNLDLDESNEFSNISRKSIESTESTIKMPLLGAEYRTGIRSSLSIASTTSTEKNINKIQQFKEWHQVLQLKSYNNEPLIVLPYVLLE
ncbi:mediator of RNA polymerase II transcription subunit 26 [Drosophila eugracilis]|uniref:mediator of RNA polymerase II transcription subunit 26 n=1 Tax=Drosophila eugracilis TaxID=29029 RepID=UPI001BDB1AE2|nr:mediator of RNA polymerase II transcription subunit 26 [Drosophila eugracilis]